MKGEFVRIRGAREHNLKNIDVDIPKNKLVVVTGVSGSGKSSLAFDTLYVEGHRRYMEGVSSYVKQFLGLRKKPDVDSIEGLSPTISVGQKTCSRAPRSTVSTATDIHDYLRLLFSKIGIPTSPFTGLPLTRLSPSLITSTLSSLPSSSFIRILAPVYCPDYQHYLKVISTVKNLQLSTVKIGDTLCDVHEAEELCNVDCMQVVLHETIVTDGTFNEILPHVQSALAFGNGVANIEIVSLPDGYQSTEYYPRQVLTFAEHFSCPFSGFSFGEVSPKIFSSNIRGSSCEECNGLGKVHTLDIDLIIPDEKISILDGAIDPLGPLSTGKLAPYRHIVLEKCKCEILSVSQKYNIDLALPWDLLEEKFQNIILWGEHGKPSGFKGVIAYLNESKYGAEKYSMFGKCSKCGGYRLNQKGLSVKIRDKHIGELCSMSVVELIAWFNELERDLTESEISMSSEIIQEIVKRLKLIANVGLGYLSLDRDFSSLSGGEAQRIRLASLIGSGLSGLIYVLDEPSVGLHQRDNKLLIDSLKNLRDLHNTVVVIEHDLDTIEAADYIVDIGPGPGPTGGKVVAQGSLEDIALNPDSVTGQYLNGDIQIHIPIKKDKHFTHWIKINGARKNNLKYIDIQIPIGGFTCITGVSGSGKSTLVREILYPIAMHKVHCSFRVTSECDSVSGLEHIDKVIQIDQSPIGRTSTSTPATYIGLFTFIRAWFASMPLAKSRKYTESRFSFNTPGGRCEACKGDGSVKIEMHFLPDIYVKCEECNGKRYNKETLEVTYKGKSISDILEMNVDQALLFFKSAPLIVEKLKSLKMVGMGYVKIGQHSATLSGGESQRIKLSRELSKRSTGNTLYILDEPTTGLHISDTQNLLEVLHSLSSLGNTVVVVEHNMHVIKTADYIVDIGPEGGKFGGRVMGFGSTREIVKNYPDSITAEYLKEYL